MDINEAILMYVKVRVTYKDLIKLLACKVMVLLAVAPEVAPEWQG